ncbi:MAG TPA: hypothetical protein VF311_08970 [Terriglobales bacterium]
MLGVAYLTRRCPSQLGDQLRLAGYTVWEALTASEVLHLCEYQGIDAVVIDAGMEDRDLPEVQGRYISLRLNENATAADVIWSWSSCSPQQ